MRTAEMMELAGVPTYYVTHTVAESAGYGNVRIWNCTERSGVLIPSCEILIPALRLMIVCKDVTLAAQEVFNTEMLAAGLIH